MINSGFGDLKTQLSTDVEIEHSQRVQDMPPSLDDDDEEPAFKYDLETEVRKLRAENEQLRENLAYYQNAYDELKIKAIKWQSQQGKGRQKKKLRYSDAEIKQFKADGMTIKHIADICNVSRSTIYKRLKSV